MSCNHTAPYATSDNAPALRRTGYRPKAPYHTEHNGGPNLTGQSQRAPSDSSRASSLRPPFSLHESSATVTAPARPHRRDSRPQTALSVAAPFDRDDQPAPPPRRSMFRTGYHGSVQCPFDRDGATAAPRPRERTATYPYATCAPLSPSSARQQDELAPVLPLVPLRSALNDAAPREGVASRTLPLPPPPSGPMCWPVLQIRGAPAARKPRCGPHERWRLDEQVQL